MHKIDTRFEHLNASAVGMCGHRIGGQAALFASSYDNATKYGIKAVVLHQAYTSTYPPSSVPLLAFADTIWDHVAHQIFNTAGAATPKGLATTILEKAADPLHGNTWLAQYTVSWLKLFVDGTTQAHGVNFQELIFGQGSSSLCGGGNGYDLNECTFVTAVESVANNTKTVLV